MKPIPLLAAALAASLMFPTPAQDLAKTAGRQAKVLLDNEKVRVIELTIAPGDHTGMHSHPNSIVYFITGGDARQVTPDGTSTLRHSEPDRAEWIAPVTHDTFNVGQKPTRTLVIELKDAAKK